MACNKRNIKSEHCSDSSIVTTTNITTVNMDENVWSTLQYHIDLRGSIYSRLPLQDFFNLRTVCKDWYNIACKKPFFTLNLEGCHGCLDGILTYNGFSNSWNWHKLGHAPYYEAISMEGLVCNFYQVSVFDCNTWAFRTVPPTLKRLTWPKMGISVDSSSSDTQKQFRLVLGAPGFDTQVYDSKTNLWEWKPCQMPTLHKNMIYSTMGCVECNGRVYIMTEYTNEILVYDFETASWSILNPSFQCQCCKWYPTYFITLGAWNDRIFHVFYSGCTLHPPSVLVMESVDKTNQEWKQEWREYDRMPTELYLWLVSKTKLPFHALINYPLEIRASFCGNYMLVYAWNVKLTWVRRLCLYNMTTRIWEKLHAPEMKFDIPKNRI